MNCLNCKEPFEQVRKDQLFCSSNCRVTAYRKSDVTDKIVTDNVKVDVTDKIREGYCHGCNEEVNKLVCICHMCIAKDITHKSLGLKMCEV